MSEFNWKTEGDDPWNEGAWPDNQKAPARGNRSWVALLILLLAASVAAAIVFRRVNDTVEDATDTVTEDLLSSHRLVAFALAHDDAELFATVLSGRVPAWTAVQRELFERGEFVGHSAFGLEAIIESDEDQLEPPQAEFAPTLMAAELVANQAYLVTNADGVTETVELQLRSVYRRGEERWLLSPPEDDYWGQRVRFHGDILSAEYPDRDRQLASRLLLDLDETLVRLCQLMSDANCQQGSRLTIAMETDPSILLAAADDTFAYTRGRLLALPTPSLIGLPVDDSGYQALFRGYLRQVAATLAGQLSGWDCCAHAAFFQALVDYQLGQLGTHHWPISGKDFEWIIAAETDFSDLARFWSSRSPQRLERQDGWLAYAAVDFLLNRFPDLSAGDILRSLDQLRSFESWLDALYGDHLAGEGRRTLEWLSDEWFGYANASVSQTTEPPPIPLPDQALVAACVREGEEPPTSIYQLNVRDGSWAQIATDTSLALLISRIPNNGIVVSGIAFTEDGTERWQSTLWRNGESIVLVDPLDSATSLGQTDPGGEYLTAYVFEEDSQQPAGGALVDLPSCSEDGCTFLPLAGLPIWSPGGSHLLLVDDESLGQEPLHTGNAVALFADVELARSWRLYRTDRINLTLEGSSEAQFIGNGSSPFWLDDTTYGYVRVPPESSFFPSQQLVLASIADDSWSPVLDLDDIRMALSGESPVLELVIEYAGAAPDLNDVVHLIVREIQNDMAHLLALDPRTGLLSPLLRISSRGDMRLGYSPNGRWLVLTGANEDPSQTGLGGVNRSLTMVYDTVSGTTQRYELGDADFIFDYSLDWSSDSRWFSVTAGGRALSLVAPEYGYDRLLITPGLCRQHVWMD